MPYVKKMSVCSKQGIKVFKEIGLIEGQVQNLPFLFGKLNTINRKCRLKKAWLISDGRIVLNDVFNDYFQTNKAWLRLPRRTMVYLPKRLCSSVSM